MKHKRIIITIVAILLTVIIAAGVAFFVIYTKATNRVNEDKLQVTASTDIIQPLAKSILLGEKAEITDAQINGILATFIQNNAQKLATKKGLQLKSAALYLHKNDICDIYMDVKYMGIDMIVNAKAVITLDKDDKNIILVLTEAKIGTLNIPVDWMTNRLNNSESFKKLDGTINIKTNILTVPASYSTNVYNMDIEFELTNLQTDEGIVEIETSSANDLLSGILNKLF
ncbi:hypothetical protein AGMMS50284_0820 [Clostridia bacterium]|nr:hypothetical protein AGMMS50284_0820 [Clostridia bacterium]